MRGATHSFNNASDLILRLCLFGIVVGSSGCIVRNVHQRFLLCDLQSCFSGVLSLSAIGYRFRSY